MAAIRALGIVIALLGFFLIGAPLQWGLARVAPAFADRIPRIFCRSLLWLLKVRVSKHGECNLDRPLLVVANHTSWIDILALGEIAPFCFLAKREISRWPILSAFAEVQGTVFVDRKRRRTIPRANREMAAQMKGGRPVLLFPEGTTTAGAEPGPFLSSHLACARDLLREKAALDTVDVVPAAVAYSTPGAAWVGDDNLASHVWRSLRAPPVHCAVSFGAPILFGRDSDRKQIAKAARESVIAMLARASAGARSNAASERDMTSDLESLNAASR